MGSEEREKMTGSSGAERAGTRDHSLAPPEAEPSTRLDELDADEWFAVARKANPELTREEFDEQWAAFQSLKRRKGQQ